jgi:branched-chain amino acid transport system substrate-binding protein
VDSNAQTIKVGVLYDWTPRPALDVYTVFDDYLDAMRLTFEDAFAKGLIDRPIELVINECQGLPRGSVQAVIDGYEELVDAECVLILGPLISENVVDLRIFVDALAPNRQVPYVGWVGSEQALSEWGFELNNGGHPEEALTIASIMQQDGITSTVAVIENSLIGQHYLKFFRDAADIFEIEITGVVLVPQVEADKTDAIAKAKATGAQSILGLGFGYGLWGINEGKRANGWEVPVYCITNGLAYMYSSDWHRQLSGFTILDQYDEKNEAGQQFLDRFNAKFGRRPEYYIPLYGYDHARVAVEAVRRAEPLSPRGVRDSLERIKGVPAACGAPGTWIKFGRYVHQGWMGSGFLVARTVDAEGDGTTYRGVLGSPRNLML